MSLTRLSAKNGRESEKKDNADREVTVKKSTCIIGEMELAISDYL